MRILLMFIICVVFLLAENLYAHGLFLDIKNGQLHAYYSGNSPANEATVTVVNQQGIIILQDKTDENGICKLPENLESPPELIIVEAPGGHRTQIKWREVLEERHKGLFDFLIIRIALGIIVLAGSGFILKHILIKKVRKA